MTVDELEYKMDHPQLYEPPDIPGLYATYTENNELDKPKGENLPDYNIFCGCGLVTVLSLALLTCFCR